MKTEMFLSDEIIESDLEVVYNVTSVSDLYLTGDHL